MGFRGQAAWVATATVAAPIWALASVALAARFLCNPVRFCRRVDRSKMSFPDPAPGLQHRYFEVGEGVKLHAATHALGTGRPLLLLVHGFPELWHSWHHQISAFMADYEIVAIDMRGYGGSDAPRGVQRYRMEHLCGDLAAVVTAAGHTSCLLVAHDWGGAVAWCFAANYPRMVDRLAVLCSPHPAAFQDPRRCTAAQRRKSWYFLLFMARGLPEALLRSRDFQMVEELMTQAPGGARTPGAISPEDVERYKAGLARPGALTAAVNYYRASIESLTSRPSKAVQTTVAAKLPMPVLLLFAQHDSAFCASMFTEMEAHAEVVSVEELPECSHWAQLDRPDLVNARLRTFFAGAARAKPGSSANAGAVSLDATSRVGTAPAQQGRPFSRQASTALLRHGSA